MRRSRMGGAVVVALVLTACGDFWEELEEEPDGQESSAAEEPPGEDPEALEAAEYETPLLGEFVFEPGPCPFEIEVPVEVECGELEVPESRTGLSEARIRIAVAVLRTPSSSPEPDPVVFLQGGPGGVVLAEHWMWLSGADDWRHHPILVDRDMILVDQRGVGYSTPSLWCDDEGGESPDECHDRLVGEGATLAAYSTPENAADIASLRRALGYDEWNLYGGSYGTRLAFAILRDHPEGVRSVVVEGVYPLDVVPAYEQYAANTLAAIGELAEACAQQPDCSDTYGDVEELLVSALNAAEQDPAAPLDGFELFDLVFGALYGTETLVDVPYALQRAVEGEYEDAEDLLTAAGGGFGPGSLRTAGDPTEQATGMFHSVECREEHAFTDVDEVEAELEAMVDEGLDQLLAEILYNAVAYPASHICPAWDSGVASEQESAPLVSDVPVLLLSGRFDPITPPSWAAVAAENLSRGVDVVAPGLSHSVTLEHECIDTIMWEFLTDPAVVPDTSCLADIEVPRITVAG